MSRPRWCGRPDCNPDTRMIEVGDERLPERCPCATRSSLETQLAYHQGEVRRLLAEIAERDAPEWARGPTWPP